MALAIDVYGSLITLPDNEKSYVETWGTDDPKLQKWRRKDLPDYFDDIKKDEDGNALLNARQSEYAKEEVRRCKEGFYFMSNGVLTYITGKHYFFFGGGLIALSVNTDISIRKETKISNLVLS